MAFSVVRKKWLQQFNTKEEDPFKFVTDGTIYCKSCEKTFVVTKKSQLQQHASSEKHTKSAEIKLKRKASQIQLEDLLEPKPKYSRSQILGKELCEAMLSANIPWAKLQDPRLRSFLETNIGVKIPGES